MSGVLLEARPFRPFKSSEEYLYAMKEDLAEWFQTLYPHLGINVENFMDRLETGVALCEHANAVKSQAAEYVQKKQARKVMTKSVTSSLAQAQALVYIQDVKFFSTAKPGTFFARDNVCNFIQWCRQSLQIIECLLFESDDLIMRKNEKHVILCLLEVARRGAKYGMLAPMLVQMERQIDREIAADQKKLGVSEQENGLDEDSDSELEDEQPMLMYGPLPQIVTNDLKSLDEMVRDLVEKCTCPTQFPMIRVSEGKYRIGDTKVLIFVRILRNHVMVRVGGGWDTLSHYLDKHDPCRCRSQHRITQGARLVNKPGATDLSRAHVYYDRSPPRQPQQTITNGAHQNNNNNGKDFLGPPMNSLNRSRSRSPSHISRRSVSPNFPRKSLVPPTNRSRSPTPNYTSTHLTKLKTNKSQNQGPQSLPYIPTSYPNTSPVHKHSNGKASHVAVIQVPATVKTEATLQVSDALTDHSDNASEVSDEGYRSLGIIHNDKSKNRASLYSQNSIEDADESEHHNSIDYEDDTNDCGLRRTQFSQRIYGEGQVDAKGAPKIKERSSSRSGSVEKNQEDATSSPKSPFKRSDSSESAPSPDTTTNKVTPLQTRRASKGSINNTWNGRQKAARPSITAETFTRNSSSRRSISNYDHNGRRVSQSANTSPTKGRLRQELLKAVKNNSDDTRIVQEVQALLKKYGSLSILEDDFDVSIPRDDDKSAARSPRKDSKPDNNISRIPAPISHRA